MELDVECLRPTDERAPGQSASGQADRPPHGANQAGATAAQRGPHAERHDAAPAAPAAAAETEEARQARQERETRRALLRDFDRSQLTLANFCVLKRLKPDALTPLLEQARKEAALKQRPPQQDAQHAGPAQRRDDRRPGRPADRAGPRPDSRRPRGPSTGQS